MGRVYNENNVRSQVCIPGAVDVLTDFAEPPDLTGTSNIATSFISGLAAQAAEQLLPALYSRNCSLYFLLLEGL